MSNDLNERIATLYNDLGSWRKVGSTISPGDDSGRYGALANALYNGKIDDSPTLRAALGMALKRVPTEPCSCGEVHAHTCAEGRKQERLRKSKRPELLRQIMEVAVPFLQARLEE